MSHVIEIIRPIRAEELFALVDRDPELTLLEQGAGWTTVSWRKGNDEATFELSQGRISITSPSDKAWEKACELAAQLGAEVSGEADGIAVSPGHAGRAGAARSLWLGWPLLVLVLAALLVWKW